MSLAKFAPSAGILYRGSPAVRLPSIGMDLHCPDCNSSDLKKVSLAYQENVRRVETRNSAPRVSVRERRPESDRRRSDHARRSLDTAFEASQSAKEMVLR